MNIAQHEIAGWKFRGKLEDFEENSPGDEFDLVPEPENPYDPCAVRLEFDGRHTGYVPRPLNEALIVLGVQNFQAEFVEIGPKGPILVYSFDSQGVIDEIKKNQAS